MSITKDSVKLLLSFLEKNYPKTYEDVEVIKKAAPPQLNPDELFNMLFFCREEGLVDASPIEETATGIVDFKFIRINSKGIRFLKGF